jgi:hypothetical protein
MFTRDTCPRRGPHPLTEGSFSTKLNEEEEKMSVTFNPAFQETKADKGLEFTIKVYDNGITMVANRISSINFPEPGWEDEMIKSFKATLPYIAEAIQNRRSLNHKTNPQEK